jgi:hypothetical protein
MSPPVSGVGVLDTMRQRRIPRRRYAASYRQDRGSFYVASDQSPQNSGTRIRAADLSDPPACRWWIVMRLDSSRSRLAIDSDTRERLIRLASRFIFAES